MVALSVCLFVVAVLKNFGKFLKKFKGGSFMGTFSVGAVPVTIEKEELNRFEDPWDYRVAVHGEPLLGNVDGNHSLPPAPKVSFKSFSLRTRENT